MQTKSWCVGNPPHVYPNSDEYNEIYTKIIDVIDLNKENYLTMNCYGNEDGQSRSASFKNS
jgi:hypothetical protein